MSLGSDEISNYHRIAIQKAEINNLSRKETYKFTIKTIYHPETTVKTKEIKRYMINYVKK
jgi:hypothetical protein